MADFYFAPNRETRAVTDLQYLRRQDSQRPMPCKATKYRFGNTFQHGIASPYDS